MRKASSAQARTQIRQRVADAFAEVAMDRGSCSGFWDARRMPSVGSVGQFANLIEKGESLSQGGFFVPAGLLSA